MDVAPHPNLPMKLNLGCGKDIIPSYINADIMRLKGVNVICDLRYALPFAAGAFDEVRCFDVLEHIPDLILAMNEIARILKVDGTLLVRGPVWGSWNHKVDPTHVRGFLQQSFDYFDPETPLGKKYSYSCSFRVERVTQLGDNFLFQLRRRSD